MERTRDLVFEASVGQQIARQLLNDELIVWKIAIERVNHPVAVRPDSRPFVILFISFCVCIARQVQPPVDQRLAYRGGASRRCTCFLFAVCGASVRNPVWFSTV